MPTYSHQEILRVIFGILLCILLAALDQTVVIPAVPAMAADLKAFGHLSWIVTAYLLTATAATPIYGKLSDMVGRRACLIPALIIFIVASVLCALSQSLWQLIAFRALQGLGGAGLTSMAQAAIADVVSPRERGRYQGYMASMWGVASVAGPLVGGFMTDHFSWHYVFWINVPLGLGAMWLCNRALKMLPVRGMRGRIDYIGAALLMAGVTDALLVLSWGGAEYAWMSPTIVGMAVAAVALFSMLIWYERRVPDAMLPPRLFAEAVFARGVCLAFIAAVGLLGVTFLMPLFFQLIRGADASASGFQVMPLMLANVFGAYFGGQLIRWQGRTKLAILLGFGSAAVGFAGLATIGRDSSSVLLQVAMVVVGGGIGMCMPTVLVTVQNSAPRQEVGAATGAILFLRSMGGAFGTTLVGAVLALQFSARMQAAGFARMDFGALKADGALAALGPAARLAGQTALASGFQLAFVALLVTFVIAVVVALGLQDRPLRMGAASAAEEPPAALGH